MSVVAFRRTPERMNHRLIVAPLLMLVPLSILGRTTEVSAEPVPCTTYSIDGTLSDGREATAFLHLDEEPLVGHQVYAVFSAADMEFPPSVLVTGPSGTATVSLPDGVNAVSFSAESPVSGACATGDEPDVVVVSDTVWQPGSEVSEPLSGDDPVRTLAVTGPVSPVLPIAAVLVLVAGWFAHRLRGSGRSRTGVAACRFPGIPL